VAEAVLFIFVRYVLSDFS
jgi:hypothetical protein